MHIFSIGDYNDACLIQQLEDIILETVRRSVGSKCKIEWIYPFNDQETRNPRKYTCIVYFFVLNDYY
jgi:hypothetical protein